MNAAQRQRKNRQLELHSMASIQNIRESLRESAISTKCALLEPNIRTYGSPKTRRKIDVEADHLIALQCMSPYPKSKLDLLDDLEDIHTNVPLSNSTSQLQSRISLDRNNDKQRQWGTSVRALREHETKEEQHHRQQLEMDAQSKHSPQAPLQHRIEYSSYTQSLIERTHSRLYDEPKYISMTKRVMGIEDNQKTHSVLLDLSRIEEKRSLDHQGDITSSLNLSLHDLNQHVNTPSTAHEYFTSSLEPELPLLSNQEEDDNAEYVDTTARWTKGAPAIYASGARISTDGVYIRKDVTGKIIETEPRIQLRDGDWPRGMKTYTGSMEHAIDASQYRSRPNAIHLQKEVRCGRAPQSPGIVHKHVRPHLRPGAPSLDGHEMNRRDDLGDDTKSNEGMRNNWEMMSTAHACTFRDALRSPMAKGDSETRTSYLHRSTNNGLSMSIL